MQTKPSRFHLLRPTTLLVASLTIATLATAVPHARPTAANPAAAQFAVLSIGTSGDRPFDVEKTAPMVGTHSLGAPAKDSKLTVSVAVANLRSGPSTSTKRIMRLKRGTVVTMVEQQGSWYKVRTAKGTIGWLAAKLVSSASTQSNTPSTPRARAAVTIPDNEGTEYGRNIARIAAQYVGYPYRYGAAGPNAFDCSGLTKYVFGQAGIDLPHNSKSQWNVGGQRILDMVELLPGDLVFFANTAGRGISHAAIYVGNGQIVSANTPRQGVQLNTITDSYWRSHWAGALRLGQ